MKPADLLVGILRKTGAALHNLARLFKAPLQGGIRAALVGYWERFREAPADDKTHAFQARKYPGSRARHYVVHIPRGRIARRQRPLVVVLHGCSQDHRDIEQITGFNQLADRHGFLVAYPYITSYRGLRNRNCWGWWFDREIHAGAGEVEDLWQIIEEIKEQYRVNEHRIHITGLSSGAGMAVAMIAGMPAMVRTRFATPTIGREWMIGEMGEAVADVDPDGTVRVRDALWRARVNRATPIDAGSPVRVVGIAGMILEVEPEEGAARDYRERGDRSR